MSCIILFNIGGEKLRRIRSIAEALEIDCALAEKRDHARPLGELIGLDMPFPAPEEAEPFSEEMLIMHELDEPTFAALLQSLRREGAPVALKAVVTEHNLYWSPAALARELSREHEAMLELLRKRREGEGAEGSAE